METVDGVWSSKFGVEESINLFGIAQIGFSGDDMFSSLGCFRLDNIGQDEVNIRCSRVGQELRGELDVSLVSSGGIGGLTIPPNHPPAPVIKTTLLGIFSVYENVFGLKMLI